LKGLKVKLKKLHPKAITPTYATDGSGCFDIYSLTSGEVTQTLTVDTGLAFEVPEGHVMLVFSRSGHGFKNNVRLANCVGVIDADYRGELKVKLTSDTEWNSFYVNVGDRIAQGMVLPIEQVQFEEVEELSDTERGAGGFGSSGQ
jgi:dUTP pyrophosphatase